MEGPSFEVPSADAQKEEKHEKGEVKGLEGKEGDAELSKQIEAITLGMETFLEGNPSDFEKTIEDIQRRMEKIKVDFPNYRRNERLLEWLDQVPVYVTALMALGMTAGLVYASGVPHEVMKETFAKFNYTSGGVGLGALGLGRLVEYFTEKKLVKESAEADRLRKEFVRLASQGRTLTTEHLLVGGAEYVKGKGAQAPRLEVTARQVEVARDEMGKDLESRE